MEILHSDESLLVVNKPAGLAAVPGAWEKETSPSGNLIDLLEPEFGKLWIVHRLDKVTSGVILFARTPAVHREMNRLFETRLVHKTYHALVCGTPGWEEHTARHRLRENVGHHHRTAIDHARGKSAVTHFKVLERFNSASFLEALTETGRTHQVRAHAAALGCPLLADTLYGAEPTQLIPRPALHAFSLEFDLNGASFSFTTPHPVDFETALERLRTQR